MGHSTFCLHLEYTEAECFSGGKGRNPERGLRVLELRVLELESSVLVLGD